MKLSEILGYYIKPILLKINKDYNMVESEFPRTVKFVTAEGQYYVLKRDVVGAIDFRYELTKKHKHCYERNGTMVEKGDVVVDIGAGEGAFTLKAASKAKRVYAIEPNSDYAELLRMSFIQIPNIIIIERAVSNKKGEGFLEDINFASKVKQEIPEDGYRITVDTIDDLFRHEKRIHYIKCDIEGEELNMILGAEKIIKRDRPKIAICVYHDKHHPEKIKKLLKEWVPEYKIEIVKNCVLHAYL